MIGSLGDIVAWMRTVERRLAALEQRSPYGAGAALVSVGHLYLGLSIGSDPGLWNLFWRAPVHADPQSPVTAVQGDRLCVTWRGATSQFQRFGLGETTLPPGGSLRVTMDVDTTIPLQMELSVLVAGSGHADYFAPGVTVYNDPDLNDVPVGTSRQVFVMPVPNVQPGTTMQPYVVMFPPPSAAGTTCVSAVAATVST